MKVCPKDMVRNGQKPNPLNQGGMSPKVKEFGINILTRLKRVDDHRMRSKKDNGSFRWGWILGYIRRRWRMLRLQNQAVTHWHITNGVYHDYRKYIL